MRRPGVRALQHLEAVLRALAVSTEDEIDTGRWTRAVLTTEGEVAVTLALPNLVDPPMKGAPREPLDDGRAAERILRELERFLARGQFASEEDASRAVAAEFTGRPIDEIATTATTPLDRAQDLCYRAFDAHGRLQLKLARQALALSPDCADAYVILAERSQSPDDEISLYEQGITAGERALGAERFETKDAPFWSDVSTRGYMRALMGLAQCRHCQDRLTEAVALYRRMLALNPGDNQGARWPLVGLLLETGDDAGAGELLERFAQDDMATMAYARALLAFRTGGDSPASGKALRAALQANSHVPALLIDALSAPLDLPASFSFGDEDEAAICADEIGVAWTTTEGALAWLRKLAH
jgi:tetratricopeptide (TPR) repeat protein